MILIPESIIKNENKDAVIEAAYAFLHNDVHFGDEEIPEILKGEEEVLKLLGVSHEE